MTAPKYVVEYIGAPCADDEEAGRVYCVRLRQNWQDGAYLPDVCSLCTQENAERVAAALNRQTHAESLLREASHQLNSRGRLDPGGCDDNTEAAWVYRNIQVFLSTEEV